jgi:hypothetical protein
MKKNIIWQKGILSLLLVLGSVLLLIQLYNNHQEKVINKNIAKIHTLLAGVDYQSWTLKSPDSLNILFKNLCDERLHTDSLLYDTYIYTDTDNPTEILMYACNDFDKKTHGISSIIELLEESKISVGNFGELSIKKKLLRLVVPNSLYRNGIRYSHIIDYHFVLVRNKLSVNMRFIMKLFKQKKSIPKKVRPLWC